MCKIQNCRYVGSKSKPISFIAKVLDMENIKFNTFSDGACFSYSNVKFIASASEHLETIKNEVTEREYYVLLNSLLCSLLTKFQILLNIIKHSYFLLRKVIFGV